MTGSQLRNRMYGNLPLAMVIDGVSSGSIAETIRGQLFRVEVATSLNDLLRRRHRPRPDIFVLVNNLADANLRIAQLVIQLRWRSPMVMIGDDGDVPLDLTARELDAFSCLGAGLTSSRAIGRHLSITPRAAQDLVMGLSNKLGIRRVALVGLAYELGLIATTAKKHIEADGDD